MNTFYGGRPGASFKIVKKFDSINAMTTAFNQGVNYTDVKYGDYVIVQDNNENSLYRRVYNGADYIGSLNVNIITNETNNITNTTTVSATNQGDIDIADFIQDWLEQHSGLTLDSTITSTGENPVAGKTIYSFVNNKIGDIETAIAAINTIIGGTP